MRPMPGAIDCYKELAEKFDTYILSTSPWKNPSAWRHKLEWVLEHLGSSDGEPAYKRLILTHHKNLNKGDFLIDDRPNNGAWQFEGELIRFGTPRFPDWETVKKYLLTKLQQEIILKDSLCVGAENKMIAATSHLSRSKFYKDEDTRMIRIENKTATLEDAISIAALAHKGQTEKAGARYILHPLRIMMKMKTELEMMAGILHDVVEDSDQWTIDKLRKRGFNDEVLEAVKCLTHGEGESYEDYIERVQTNRIARRVKLADLEDNMNIMRIGTDLKEKDFKRLEKYHKTWLKLKED